jgi:uncharacterized YccA/Bax inhibitor family protein
MAKGIQDYTAQESLAPYIKAVVAQAGVEVDPCRAVYTITAAAHVLTVNDEDITFTGMLKGVIYPICATKCASVNVIFLY